MAKSDFNVDEDNYYNPSSVMNNNTFSQNQNTNQNNGFNNSSQNNFHNNDYSEYTDFSSIGTNKQGNFVDDSNIVFEENVNETPEEKIKYKLSIINKKVVLVIFLAILVIAILGFVLYLVVSKNIASYKAEIIIPDVIYLEESSNISVIAQGKKNIEQTTTKFSSSDEKVLTILEGTMQGQDVLNTIIPIQEGVATIEVNSTLNNRNMGSVKKEVQVCPAFNSSLINSKTVSVQKSSTVELKINFGEGKCSENIFYESSNEQIFTVTNNGKVEGVNTGSAVLTIRKGQRSFTVPVYVTDNFVSMQSITTNVNKLQLLPEQKTRLLVSYFPSNATTQNIDYYSDNSVAVSVDEFGVITAHKEGTATIKVINGNRTADFEVTVIVSKGVSKDGTTTVGVSLDKTSLTLVQGTSQKVIALVAPDNAKDKTLIWSTSNPAIAAVNSAGVIVGKNIGKTLVTAKTNNGISKSIEVTVNPIKNPVIAPSDNIVSGAWHTKTYTLNFSGSESGVTYYYGTSENNMNQTGEKLKVIENGNATYYVKACKENICSGISTYYSKLDTNKPRVITVAGIETGKVREDVVHIALKDVTSFIKNWCVTTVNNVEKCKWQNINFVPSPVVKYTVKNNGTYYVFAKDVAGNISEPLSFKMTNIG